MTSCTKTEDDDQTSLPGFRFHPNDEELLVFYLKRKVEKKPLRIELIKQVDIYKHEPWDLPKSSIVGENESYFFCKRERKYKNSIRPNRVTKSGFWKATGIDKSVYSQEGQGHDSIGLKKTLVYYCGSAGKGTKTEWMMHEFRLPSNNIDINSKSSTDKVSTQEAEVWTICRIFKRNVSQRKLHLPGQSRETATRHDCRGHQTSSKACSIDSSNWGSNYISFNHAEAVKYQQYDDKRSLEWQGSDQRMSSGLTDQQPRESTITSTSSSFFSPDQGNVIDHEQFFRYGNWDELRSAVDPSLL